MGLAVSVHTPAFSVASAPAAHSDDMSSRAHRLLPVLLLAVAVTTACDGSSAPASGPAQTRAASPPAVPTPPPRGDFVDTIDNPWMPWQVGTRWRFVGHTAEGTERTVVTVTDRTRIVDGIRATVVRDVVYLDGRLLEDTFDWYAQDSAGNVWYLGEDTREYDGAEVDRTGSWEAGVDGAEAGIAMLAHPAVGAAYRQEYYRGEAEDQAQVLATDRSAKVPYGDLTGLLQTKDFTRLEPTADEHKYYAKGVGVVLEVSLHGNERTELVSMAVERRRRG